MSIPDRSGAGATPADVTIPGGAGWVTHATPAWSWRNKLGIGGITKMTIKELAKTPGRLGFAVTGKNTTLAVGPASLPLAATVVLDTPATAGGQCAELRFPGPSPAPHCVPNGRGSTAVCK